MRNYIIYCSLLFCIKVYCQNPVIPARIINTSKPFLIINPAGHKGQVRSLLVTGDQKYIVTGGFDKTIKIWDIEAGELSREILGEIGTGSNGMVYNMALSPDNKLLATGGWFGNDDETEDLGDIRIYNFNTGKLLYLLKAHRNVINALEFTSDSKKLLSADAEGDLFLWDLDSKKIIREFNHKDLKLEYGFDDEIRDIALNGNNFITSDQYGRIKFWSVDKKDTLGCDHYYEQIQADGVAYSPDGKYMVAVVDTFLTIYDTKYKPVAEARGELSFIFASFSPDSKKIIFGSAGKGDKHPCSVLSLENNVWTPYAEFEGMDNTVMTGAFIDNETFAIAGGNKDEVVIVRLHGINETPTVVKRMAGKGDIIYSVALSGNKLAYSDIWTENFGFSKFNRQFDLFSKDFGIPDTIIKWNKPVVINGDYSLKRYRIGSALNGGLKIIKNNTVYDSIPLKYWNGDQHRTFSFVNDFIVSGAAYGMLKAYNYYGVELSKFIGHIGDIEGISISSDGKKLISSSNDRTMKIWPLEQLGKPNNNDTAISVANYCKRMNIYSTFEKVFDLIKVGNESKQPSKEAWLKVIEALVTNDYHCSTFKNKFTDYFSNEIYPIASVFVDESGDWIIWNEKGYFASSKKGSKYVGYHINQGKNKESKYYPFEQFDLKYNRPDIILKDLGMAGEDVIKAYYLAYQKRLKRMGIDESRLSGEIHLPELTILNHQYDSQKQEVSVTVSAIDEKYELDRLNIYVNDVPIYGTMGISLKKDSVKNYSANLAFQLCPGKNKVQISVLNIKGAESLKETFTVINNETVKPDLYLISLGVSKYRDERFNLNYAAKDAEDVVKFFENSSLYNKVYIKKLTNEEVTRVSLLKIKEEFLKTARAKDVVMIFAAGHGVLDQNMNYYFGTWDMDFNNPPAGGIAYEDLELILDGIKPLRKLFFMDSCHSGELDKDEFSVADNTKIEVNNITFRNAGNVNAVFKNGFGLSQSSQLASDLFADLRRGTGATIISSAGGAEFAMESNAWNNGLFTYCFLSGLKEKTADINKDGEILISEIQDYVYSQVIKLSGGKQKPTTRRENLEFDFRIW